MTPQPTHDAPIGILIANTGTADSPTPEDIARFLEDMLLDKHLVSCPHIIWKPILKHFILPKRPLKTKGRYEQIWTDQGSPFMITSFEQRAALETELIERGHNVRVACGMRYGNPSIAVALDELVKAGCNTIVLVPLYPQQANVTTLTTTEAFDQAVSELSAKQNASIKCHYIKSYCEQEAYLQALASSITQLWKWQPGSRILFSYHSTLVADIEKGDPYYGQTISTSEGVARILGIPDQDWACAYHSRFDSRKWLKPPAEEVLEAWAAEGVCDVAVIAPVFTADCIETLVDIKVEQRKFYLKQYAQHNPAGQPAHFTYIPTLGAHPDHIAVLADCVESSAALSSTQD